MSDPFWDELDQALPRARRGEPGWAELRRGTFARLKEGRPRRAWLAGTLAAGMAAAAVVFVARGERAQELRSVPPEDLEFLENTPVLEHFDVLLEATELDRA